MGGTAPTYKIGEKGLLKRNLPNQHPVGLPNLNQKEAKKKNIPKNLKELMQQHRKFLHGRGHRKLKDNVRILEDMQSCVYENQDRLVATLISQVLIEFEIRLFLLGNHKMQRIRNPELSLNRLLPKIPAHALTDVDIQNLRDYVAAEWKKADVWKGFTCSHKKQTHIDKAVIQRRVMSV